MEIQQEIKSLASTFQKRTGSFGEQVSLGYSKGPDEGHTLALQRSSGLHGHYIGPAQSLTNIPFTTDSTLRAGCPTWQPRGMCRFKCNFKFIGSYETNWRYRP